MIKREEIRILKSIEQKLREKKKESLIKKINSLIEILQEFLIDGDDSFREEILDYYQIYIKIKRKEVIIASDYCFKNKITLNDLPLHYLAELKDRLQEKIEVAHKSILNEIEKLIIE